MYVRIQIDKCWFTECQLFQVLWNMWNFPPSHWLFSHLFTIPRWIAPSLPFSLPSLKIAITASTACHCLFAEKVIARSPDVMQKLSQPIPVNRKGEYLLLTAVHSFQMIMDDKLWSITLKWCVKFFLS